MQFKCIPSFTDNTLGWFSSIWKYSKEVKVAVVYYMLSFFSTCTSKNQHPWCDFCLILFLVHYINFWFNRSDHSKLISTGAILAVFWRLAAGVFVCVDSWEQYRPWGTAQTVAFSQRTKTWTGLETRHTSPLWAGRLVRQTLTCFNTQQAVYLYQATCLDSLKASNWHFDVFKRRQMICKPPTRSHKYLSAPAGKEVLWNRTKKLIFLFFPSRNCRFTTFTFHFLGNVISLQN